MNKKVLKYAGFAAVIGGTVAITLAGGDAGDIVKVVGLVVSLVGVITALIVTK